MWENNDGMMNAASGVGKGGLLAGEDVVGLTLRQQSSSANGYQIQSPQERTRPMSQPTTARKSETRSHPGKPLDNNLGGESSQSTLSRHTSPVHDGGDHDASHFPGNPQRALPGIGEMKVSDMVDKPQYLKPVSKTYLKPPLEKPVTLRTMAKRQSHVERLNAQQLSPQMTFFLSSMKGGDGGTDSELHFAQKVRRTIPVAWCPAGGSDTHHRTAVSAEVHHDIAAKLKKANEEYLQITQESFKDKIRVTEEMDGQLHKLLRSGPTVISRYSLDLMRQQREKNAAGSGTGKAALPPPSAGIEETDLQELMRLAMTDDSEMEKFLAEH